MGCPNLKIGIYISTCNVGQSTVPTKNDAVTIYSGLKYEFIFRCNLGQQSDAVTIYSGFNLLTSRSSTHSLEGSITTEPAHNNGHKLSTELRGTCRPHFRKRPEGYRYRGPAADTVYTPWRCRATWNKMGVEPGVSDNTVRSISCVDPECHVENDEHKSTSRAAT